MITNRDETSVLETLRKAFSSSNVQELAADHYVATVLRIVENPASLSLLVHKGSSNLVSFPTVKVNSGESPIAGALRGLKEEIGVNLPSTYR